MSTANFSSESVFVNTSSLVGPPTQDEWYAQRTTSTSITTNVETATQRSGVAGVVARFGSLSSVIRVAGVAAVVLSMCLFLLDGMGVVNDIQRFFTMLLLTGVLSTGGFVLAFLLKERRGARSFFGLSLLSVPVNFTVLGALLYSIIQFDQVSMVYPTVAHWEILDAASLGSAVLIALAALIPVTILGISVMAREGRFWLTASLLVSSLLLLLPVRDNTWIAPLVALVVLALITIVKRFGENTISLKTLTGRYVQTLLFLPPAIMLFRSFWLYDVSALSTLVIAVTIFIGLRYASQQIIHAGFVSNSMHVFSAVVALACAVLSLEVLYPAVGTDYLAIIFTVVFGSLMLDLESSVKDASFVKIIAIGTSLVLAFGVLLHQQIFDGMLVVFSGILVSIALVLVGFIQTHKEKTLIGGVTLLGVVLLNAAGIVTFFIDAGWLGIAALGAMAILVASLLERFGPLLTVQARSWLVR